MKKVNFLFVFVYTSSIDSSVEALGRACGHNVKFCDIGPWMAWGMCSQNCGGPGIQMRRKPICCDVNRVRSLDECLNACGKNKNEFNNITTDSRTCGSHCYNGGTFDLTRQTCDCVNGTWGRCCKGQEDDCRSSPCKHGYCYDRLFGYSCFCYSGYSGRNCEKVATSTISSPFTFGTSKFSSTTTVPLKTKPRTTATIIQPTIQTTTTKKPTPTTPPQSILFPTKQHITPKPSTKIQRFETKTTHVKLTDQYNLGAVTTIKNKPQRPQSFRSAIVDQGIVQACASSPCSHGICIPYGNQHVCYCLPGYTGQNCQIEKDECESEPCSYGECFDKVNDYHCVCNMFFHGKRCTKMTLWGILSISLGCLILVTLCSCCVCCIPSRKRNDDNKENDNRKQVVPKKNRPKPPTERSRYQVFSKKNQPKPPTERSRYQVFPKKNQPKPPTERSMMAWSL